MLADLRHLPTVMTSPNFRGFEPRRKTSHCHVERRPEISACLDSPVPNIVVMAQTQLCMRTSHQRRTPHLGIMIKCTKVPARRRRVGTPALAPISSAYAVAASQLGKRLY